MGKEPAMVGQMKSLVTRGRLPSARSDVLAAGYADGTVLMIRIEDGAEIVVRRATGNAVSALAWSGRGAVLGACRGSRRGRVADAIAPRTPRTGRIVLSPQTGELAMLGTVTSAKRTRVLLTDIAFATTLAARRVLQHRRGAGANQYAARTKNRAA